MRTPLILVLLTSTACAWVPDEFPVKVELPSDATDEQVEALTEAIANIDAAAEFDVLELVSSDGRRRSPDRIQVASTGLTYAEAWQRGYRVDVARHRMRGCTIWLSTDVGPKTATHELLHCLDVRHDETPGSVMGEHGGFDILPTHVAHLRALAGLD
jgi:hypothetical protein